MGSDRPRWRQVENSQEVTENFPWKALPAQEIRLRGTGKREPAHAERCGDLAVNRVDGE